MQSKHISAALSAQVQQTELVAAQVSFVAHVLTLDPYLSVSTNVLLGILLANDRTGPADL